MTIEILMPALSPTMEEGTLAKWLVNEGDSISSGDLIAEIETDKATMEVEAVDDGKIGQLLVPVLLFEFKLWVITSPYVLNVPWTTSGLSWKFNEMTYMLCTSKILNINHSAVYKWYLISQIHVEYEER